MPWPLLLIHGYIEHGGGILRVMQKVCDAGLPESNSLAAIRICVSISIVMDQRQLSTTGL